MTVRNAQQIIGLSSSFTGPIRCCYPGDQSDALLSREHASFSPVRQGSKQGLWSGRNIFQNSSHVTVQFTSKDCSVIFVAQFFVLISRALVILRLPLHIQACHMPTCKCSRRLPSSQLVNDTYRA